MNKFTPTRDVYRITFEPAGALEVTNEYSGLAVASAHLYRVRRSLARMPHVLNLAQWRIVMTKYEPPPFAAYVGIDWADKKHDLCIQIPAEGTQEFEVIPHRANSIDEWLRPVRCPNLGHPRSRICSTPSDDADFPARMLGVHAIFLRWQWIVWAVGGNQPELWLQRLVSRHNPALQPLTLPCV